MRNRLLVGMGMAGLFAGLLPAQESYRAEIEKWRKTREAGLIADDGWTTVVGLFWLKDGENSVGADPKSRITLPEGAAPARVGSFLYRRGRVTFTVEPGVKVTSGGVPVTHIEMRPDSSGSPTVIAVNDLSMFVLGHGERFAIRLRDKNSQFRKEFKGLHWYPVEGTWRINAKWVPYTAGRRMAMESIIGDTSQEPSPGYASFKVDGVEYRLEPVLEAKMLFFVFKDKTAGKETYPAGRFLYTPLPQDGYVMLDFNRAFTPPCAFSPYLLCPLPPTQNRLAVRIPAGELDYKH